MIRVTDSIELDESELEESFVRSSGPGGQNVNKLSTAVQLRFDVRRSPSLPNDVAIRLMKLAGSRMTKDGVLVLIAQNHRTQERNRAEAREKEAGVLSLLVGDLDDPDGSIRAAVDRAERVELTGWLDAEALQGQLLLRVPAAAPARNRSRRWNFKNTLHSGSNWPGRAGIPTAGPSIPGQSRVARDSGLFR